MSSSTDTAPTPDATDDSTATPPAPPAPTDMDGKDWQAEATKWKEHARKHEELWKATGKAPGDLKEILDKARRFDELEESQKSELQKAADRAAAAEARAAEIEVRATRAEVAAEKGIPAALLSGSTLEELQASADALIAFRGEQRKPDFGAGDRGDDVKRKPQITRAALADMSPEEINQARLDGRLDDVLGIKPKP